jgi:alpha-D-ribose 1-methylphosphonate 5-triphosphate synthase subunit PhnH
VLGSGFADPVRCSQAVFRLAMRAMAAPGRIVPVETTLRPPTPLFGPAAALLLTLCDFETPLWCDRPLSENAEVAEFLRFHTGARLVLSPGEAAFAVVADAQRLPALTDFAQGTREYPDRSSTLLVQVERLEPRGWRLEGPGIRHFACLCAAPLPAAFLAELGANRSRFPCGVDLLLVTQDAIAALPRSTRVEEAA